MTLRRTRTNHLVERIMIETMETRFMERWYGKHNIISGLFGSMDFVDIQIDVNCSFKANMNIVLSKKTLERENVILC